MSANLKTITNTEIGASATPQRRTNFFVYPACKAAVMSDILTVHTFIITVD